MSTGLVEVFKRAALDANENAQLCDLRYGTVVGVNPLKVQVTNLFTIPESLLVVPEHLTDYEMTVSIKGEYGWETQNKSGGSGESAFTSHNHSITQSEKKVFVHAALKVDDKVALLRKQGGQSYFILDRLPKE